MRVLTLLPDLGIGGTQRVAQNLTLAMQARGATTAVYPHRALGPRQQPLHEHAIPLLPDLQAALAWRPDIVHIHRSGRPDPAETALLRSLRTAGAKIVETNVFARYDWTEGGRLIDAHCLLSHWCAYKWHAWAGPAARSRRTFILSNCLDPAAIRPPTPAERTAARAALGIPAARFLFGRIGQPLPPKWSPAIFDAFQRVAATGRDIGLLLVGAPADYPALAVALPPDIARRIVFRPPTADDRQLQSWFGALDAFLHLSEIGESFGMVLCEAMLAGVPVITLSTPLRDNSQLEIVGHDLGGLVALDLASVPAAMLRLLDDPALHARLAAAGPAWVTSRFAPATIAPRLAAIYEAVLDPATPPPPDPDNPPSRAWIDTMLSTGLGPRPTTLQRLQFNLLHTPLAYRTRLTTRHLLGR